MMVIDYTVGFGSAAVGLEIRPTHPEFRFALVIDMYMRPRLLAENIPVRCGTAPVDIVGTVSSTESVAPEYMSVLLFALMLWRHHYSNPLASQITRISYMPTHLATP
jgi:hypothetical protein